MFNKLYIVFFATLCFSSIKTDFNNFRYIENEIDAINSNIVDGKLSSFPIYLGGNNKTISIKPILGLRMSQVGFELDSLNIKNTITWISPGVSIELYKPIINPIAPFIIYGWSNFYKHSIYGMTDYSNAYFKLNPDYYAGYSSQSQWDSDYLRNGIDFDENIYGLLIKGNLFELKIGNCSPRFGPSLSSNLFLSGQYPAFSNVYFKIYGKNIQYHLLYGELESKILIDPDDHDSFFKPRTVYYHRLDYYVKENFRIGFFETVISGRNRLDLSYLNPLSFYWSAQHAKSDKDNLLMGFDWEFITKNKDRLYGAFIMDEWAPTKTFGANKISEDDTHNHNWFGYQFGVTKLITIKNITSSIKAEYTVTSPNLYSHDVDRNFPQHHNYNLGYWNGGNSESSNFYLHTIISEKTIIYFHYSAHSKGVSGYNVDNNLNFNLWAKNNFKIGIEYFLNNNLCVDANYNIISSNELYNGDRNGFTFNLKYNIDY